VNLHILHPRVLQANLHTVSSTLIKIPNWGNVFLDAGEGTYYQVARQFGKEGVADILRNTKFIFVSHSHADHLMGVAMLLRKRLELSPPPEHPLYLVTIQSVHQAFLEYQQLEYLGIKTVSHSDPIPDTGNDVIPILSESLYFRRPGQYADQGYWAVRGDAPWADIHRNVANSERLKQSLGLSRVATVNMMHGTRAYGLVINHQDGWSLAFSGDTEPTENLVHAAPGATLLIHEATMGDDQVEMARAKKHSTFGEAIDIGKLYVLYYHFCKADANPYSWTG
jgi:ribonuclease Z